MIPDRSSSPLIIGIAGGTGSGKTTLVNKLKSVLGDEVVTLCHDFYYKSNEHLPLEERKKLNYDHPNAFDTEMMIRDIQYLKKGQSINRCSGRIFRRQRKSYKNGH